MVESSICYVKYSIPDHIHFSKWKSSFAFQCNVADITPTKMS